MITTIVLRVVFGEVTVGEWSFDCHRMDGPPELGSPIAVDTGHDPTDGEPAVMTVDITKYVELLAAGARHFPMPAVGTVVETTHGADGTVVERRRQI